MGRFLGTAKDWCWPKIASHFHAVGVSCGHIADAQSEITSDRFVVRIAVADI
jgi:hypothetical protein